MKKQLNMEPEMKYLGADFHDTGLIREIKNGLTCKAQNRKYSLTSSRMRSLSTVPSLGV